MVALLENKTTINIQRKTFTDTQKYTEQSKLELKPKIVEEVDI